MGFGFIIDFSPFIGIEKVVDLKLIRATSSAFSNMWLRVCRCVRRTEIPVYVCWQSVVWCVTKDRTFSYPIEHVPTNLVVYLDQVYQNFSTACISFSFTINLMSNNEIVSFPDTTFGAVYWIVICRSSAEAATAASKFKLTGHEKCSMHKMPTGSTYSLIKLTASNASKNCCNIILADCFGSNFHTICSNAIVHSKRRNSKSSTCYAGKLPRKGKKAY